MGKKLKVFVFVIILLILAPSVKAEKIAGTSAAIAYSNINADQYVSRLAIKRVLEQYNSRLVSEIDSFVSACATYDLDCYLLPSITGVESFFAKFMVPGTYNPFGWGAGYIYFDSWDDGINTVAKGLRNNYINKGADTVEKIGPIYATTYTWAPKVQFFMKKFKAEEKKIQLFLNTNRVQL